MAGRTSILNTLFLSFDWTWRKSPRRFTTYDTMTLRCHSPARTYTYIISWSANLQFFLERGGQIVCFSLFSASVLSFRWQLSFQQGEEETWYFSIPSSIEWATAIHFLFFFFFLSFIVYSGGFIYIILSFSFGYVGWCIFVCSGFLSYIPYQFRGEKSISVPSYVRSSYFAFYSFM